MVDENQRMIAKLEAAKEGNCYLDAEIEALYPRLRLWPALAEGYHYEHKANDHGSVDVLIVGNGERRRHSTIIPASYTTSLDAAIGLLPPDIYWMVGAGVVRPGEPLYGAILTHPNSMQEIATGETDVSAALACCIAALKAKIKE